MTSHPYFDAHPDEINPNGPTYRVGRPWMKDQDSPNPPDHIGARTLAVHVDFINVPTGYRDVTATGWVYTYTGHENGRIIWRGPYLTDGTVNRSDATRAPFALNSHPPITARMWRQVAEQIAHELPKITAAMIDDTAAAHQQRADDHARDAAARTIEHNQRDRHRTAEWIDHLRKIGATR